MRSSESREDYLEAILMLSEQGDVHSIAIANKLGVTKPSVSHAMKLLREGGYIKMDDDNHITLTKAGRAIAESVYSRHKTLMKLLMDMGVNEKTAFDDACKMEHDLSEESFTALCDLARERGLTID